MTTTALPPTTDAPSCPPGCSPDLWAAIVESQPPEAVSAIATDVAANACPSWCVEHSEPADPGESTIHEGETAYFGDEDDALSFECVGVKLEADRCTPGMWPALINVWANHGEITADQARALAAHLVTLADSADGTSQAGARGTAPRWTVAGDFERNWLFDRGERTSISGEYGEPTAHAELLNATATRA